MTTLFISDLHLEEGRPDITRAFSQFIRHEAIHAEALYILGDFFEVWLGDDFRSLLVTQIIDLLKEVSDAGVPSYLMQGNRDFLIGEEFCQAASCSLLNDPCVITLQNQPVLLCHGDHLCTEDKDYMAFRSTVRDPAWQNSFLAKPIDERIAVARNLRELSQTESQNKNSYILDVTESEVIPFMESFGVTRLIHGHTHRPAIHSLQIKGQAAQRIVLGDWYTQSSILRVTDGNYDLNSIPFA
ncbi:MAG: UDP-2,3-diacylglucosamine diphosphatase [Pseudomonadales bacterium]|nr:UDP-2,3-diacylglucosamine diphosphatase [Pseudomonadales bacterium]